MALSPKTDSMMQMQQPGADQEQQLFEQAFSDMAQSMLTNKVPVLAGDVVTFKIIDSDIDQGSAVGAFIVQRPTGLIYVPAVLSDNQVKPLEIMYAKEHDVFLPLSQEWVDEVDRGSLESLGTGVKTPESLYTDVDIRNLVVPPTIGRYSYASATDLRLPDFLTKTDTAGRQKFSQLLQSDIGLLKTAVAIYGHQPLMTALTVREKTAKVKEIKPTGGNLYVANRDTIPSEYAKMFGPHAPAALRGVAIKGYYSQDSRKNLHRPVNIESTVRQQEIRAPGAYRLYKSDGTSVVALMIPRPTEFENPYRYDVAGGPRSSTDNQRKVVPHSRDVTSPEDRYQDGGKIEYIGVTADGECVSVNKALIGDQLELGELEGAAAEAVSGHRAPKGGERGFFVRNRAGRLEATQIVDIKSVSTDSKGARRVKCSPMFEDITLVTDPKSPVSRITIPKGERIAMMPEDFTFVPCKKTLYLQDMICDPMNLASLYLDKLKVEGAVPLSIKSASIDEFSINGGETLDKVAATIKVAQDFYISVPDAEEIIKQANDIGRCRVLVASLPALQKLAEGEEKKDKPAKKKTTTVEEPVPHPGAAPGAEMGGMPPEAAGMDPAMAGQDPAAMGGQDPAMMGQDPAAMAAQAAPSPVDMAVQELQEEASNLHDQQMQLMEQKRQSLQQQLTAIQSVAQRAQEIAQGVPKEQSQAVQQMRASAEPGAAGGMPPGMAGGAPAQMPPSPAGQPGQPGPEMGQGPGQPQQAPITGGAQPDASVNPAMMQQASQMGDPSMFDAAAIGSLAEHSSLKDLVASYMPTLEKSLDHIGRILLTLWIKGAELRSSLGDEGYTGLEDRLRSLFRGMGDMILRVNKSSLLLPDETGGDQTNHLDTNATA